MQLKQFALDTWLDAHEHNVEFNLAASTGPQRTPAELLALHDAGDNRILQHRVSYGRTAGSEGLRDAIAEMQGVDPECVQIVTGASEALLIMMWLAAEPQANVILPHPCFPTFAALPESLHIEVRYYNIRKENGFRIDPSEIEKLADEDTKLILVNSPHNPTAATVSDSEMQDLCDFAAARNIQFVCDEVYHPIYHAVPLQSAARLPHATVISSFSKAFPFAGIRTGWIIDQDAARRERYRNARAYFSISNNTPGEILAEAAIRQQRLCCKKLRRWRVGIYRF